MAEITNITWCKSTFNPHIGCSKISPGCDNCYAEKMDKRTVFDGVTHWGAGVPRKRTSEENWDKVRTWNKKAPDTEFAGRKGFWPVFCASLADVFDNEVDPQWQHDLWNLIASTPNLTWLLLTKRIGNVARLVDPRWMEHGFPDNVWLGATVVNQEEADRDIPKLLRIPARVRFLSIEPMLGAVDLHLDRLAEWNELLLVNNGDADGIHVDWVIAGGESGRNARPMHPDWVRSLRDQCAAAGVAYFFKQWGEYVDPYSSGVGHPFIDDCQYEVVTPQRRIENPNSSEPNIWLYKVGTKAAGRQLDGELYDEFPKGENDE